MTAPLQASAVSAGTGASAVMPVASTTLGKKLVLQIWLPLGVAPLTVVDSSGGTLLGGQWVALETSQYWFAYERSNIPAGITSVTATFAADAYIAISWELAANSTFRTKSAPDTGASGTTWTSPSAAVSFTSGIALGVAATFSGSSQNFAAGSGWTAASGTGLTTGRWGSAGNGAFAEYRDIVGAGALAANGTCLSSFVYAQTLTFEDSGGGGGGGGQQNRLLLGVG